MQRKKPLTRKTALRAKKPWRVQQAMRTKASRGSGEASAAAAADKVWPLLSARSGPPFQRNERLGAVVADFYCPAARLAVVLTDGDDPRADLLAAAGYRVLALDAAEAGRNPQTLLDAVADAFVLRVIKP